MLFETPTVPERRAPPPGGGRSPRRTLAWSLLLFAACAAALWLMLFRSGAGGKTAARGPNDGNGGPPDIFGLQRDAPIDAVTSGRWTLCYGDDGSFWCEAPTSWKQYTPHDYPPGESRMLLDPRWKSVAIVILPYRMEERNAEVEIARAESRHLGRFRVRETQTRLAANGLTGYRKTFRFAGGPRTLQGMRAAEAVFVDRPLCYAIYFRGRGREYRKALPDFNHMVRTFHLGRPPALSDASSVGGASRSAQGSPIPASPGAPLPSGATAAPSGAPLPSGAAAGPAPKGTPVPAPPGAPQRAGAAVRPGPHGTPRPAPPGAPQPAAGQAAPPAPAGK